MGLIISIGMGMIFGPTVGILVLLFIFLINLSN